MRRLSLVTGALVLSVVMAGCSLLGQSTGEQPSPGAGSISPAGSPTASSAEQLSALPSRSPGPAETAKSERPVGPVPDVTPQGVVDPPPGLGLQRYTGQKLTWKDCKDGLQCATVLVPMDYADPDGVAVTLALSKKPSTSTKKLGSLFINPGGPGGSGVSYVGYFKTDGLRDYDVVGWDPRGVARSTPVKCFDSAAVEKYTLIDNSPDDTGEEKAWIEANREFGQSCLAKSGKLLQHVSTMETVRDLDLLRGLVGDKKLTFFGSSYGTLIGSTYAQMFAKNVGRMVLDGAVNITDDKVSQTQGFDRALGKFAGWCAENGCRLGDSKAEVLKSVTDLWDGLDKLPIRANRGELTEALAVTGVAYVLYENEDAWKYLLEGLQNAIFDKDGSYLLYFADLYNQRGKDGTYGQFNYSFPAVRCLDNADEGVQGANKDAAEEAKKAPTIGRFFGPDMLCPMWPVNAVPEPAKIVGAGAAPIVVIGTTGDPATPYEYAQKMARQLESGVLVTFKGVGHLAYGQSPCVQGLVVEYLVKGVVPADGSDC